MLGLVRHGKACPTFSKITNCKCLWESLSYFVYLLLGVTHPGKLQWNWISNWNNKSLISLERVEWFCWFFAFSYLHLVGYPLKLPKFAILSLVFSGIGSQPTRLSDDLTLKILKTIWGIKLIFCFHWSYKKYHTILGYAAKYSWPIGLQDVLLLTWLTCQS